MKTLFKSIDVMLQYDDVMVNQEDRPLTWQVTERLFTLW